MKIIEVTVDTDTTHAEIMQLVFTDVTVELTLLELVDLFEKIYPTLAVDSILGKQLEINHRLSKFLVNVQNEYQMNACECGAVIHIDAKMCESCSVADITKTVEPSRNADQTD